MSSDHLADASAAAAAAPAPPVAVSAYDTINPSNVNHYDWTPAHYDKSNVPDNFSNYDTMPSPSSLSPDLASPAPFKVSLISAQHERIRNEINRIDINNPTAYAQPSSSSTSLFSSSNVSSLRRSQRLVGAAFDDR